MRALVNASNGPGVQDLVNTFYDIPAVQGFALGVHGNYVSLFRSEFGKKLSVNDILKSNSRPQAWSEVCHRASLPPTLSPIYVVIYVTTPSEEFRSTYGVPQVTSAGDHLVVVETKGPFVALADHSRHRPIKGGISVGNANLKKEAGTLGGFFKDAKTTDFYILSCNHVLCDTTANDVIQQGGRDGGSASSDKVAVTTHAVPLKLPTAFTFSAPFNKVDAALSEVDSSRISADRNIRIVGTITGVAQKAKIQLGDDVVFVGKESDRQEARVYRFISRLKITVRGVVYNFGEVFELESRSYIYVGSLSVPGDSGSWVIRENTPQNNDLYGLLIAGTGQFSICCFIEAVIDELNSLGAKSFDLA